MLQLACSRRWIFQLELVVIKAYKAFKAIFVGLLNLKCFL